MRSTATFPSRARCDKPFLMPIEDVFSISGRGTVVTGRVERGIIMWATTSRSWVSARPRRRCARAWRCSASCLTKVRRVTTLACCFAAPSATRWSAARWWRPGIDHAAHEVQGRGVHLSKEEGGRHTPFFNGYRPQFYFRTTDVTGIESARRRRDGDARVTTWPSTAELITPSPWRRSCGSPSAKAAVRWVPVSSAK
jgi:elongation factor Tu